MPAMTNLYEATPSNEDDPASCTDDVNTSFEIDEPDDEEVIDNVLVIGGRTSAVDVDVAAATTPTNDTAAGTLAGSWSFSRDPKAAAISHAAAPIHRKAREDSSRSYTVPLVAIRPDDAGEQSDSSLESHTASSTPTTADVADVTAVAVVSPYTHKQKRLSPLQQAKLNATATATTLSIGNGSSIAEDTLSASIATTTTEIDIDGIASASPYAVGKLDRQHGFAEAGSTPEPNASSSGHRRTLSNISQYSSQPFPAVQALQPKKGICYWMKSICALFKSSGIGEPSVYHAVIVIFLEFFAWGLLAMPVISVLNQTFPDHTFLMNGLVMGIKGILSFLSAPLVGALSDIWGRKFFLLITVFFTCAPIPLMTINSWWFFAMISISGVFAVTFSVVFAYVADVTTMEERSRAYGIVSATFAASLVISPALGALLREMYSDTLVVALATAIAVLDVFFILVAVPESLPEKMRPQSWGAPISWEQADPFSALRKVGTDHTILMQCVTVLLSYLPEAGQYSCIFVYLKYKMGFNSMEVAIFIAVVGILSISVQVILGYLMRVLGGKRTIILGLILEMIQMLWYGFGSEAWMMWAAGILAAFASITYPAISAFVSLHSTADSQGVVQGMVTGMRGLCNGLGPAMFGIIFYFFNVDLNGDQESIAAGEGGSDVQQTAPAQKHTTSVPGPPFAIGALLVVLAICVAIFIPDTHGEAPLSRAPIEKKRSSKDAQYTLAQL